MSDKIIASVIDGTKEWSILVENDKKETVAKTITFNKGRNPVSEEDYEKLLLKKGFKKLLESGDFSEPEQNKVNHDAKVEKLEDKHKTEVGQLKDAHAKDKEKAINGIKAEIGKQKAEFEKKLEKSNNALIASEKEVDKLKNQVTALKKGK